MSSEQQAPTVRDFEATSTENYLKYEIAHLLAKNAAPLRELTDEGG